VKDDRPYLADILQVLLRVEEIGQRGREAFLRDWVLQDAAIRNSRLKARAAASRLGDPHLTIALRGHPERLFAQPEAGRPLASVCHGSKKW